MVDVCVPTFKKNVHQKASLVSELQDIFSILKTPTQSLFLTDS